MTDAAAWEYSRNMSLEQYNNTAPNRPKLNLPPTSLDTPNWDPKQYVPTPRNNIQDLAPGIRQAFVDRATGRHVSSVGGAVETVPPEIQRYQPTTPYRQINQPATRYQTTSVDRLVGANRPSPATSPPTPRTSGLTAIVDMVSTPPAAAPRSPLPPNPTPGAKPNNLPVAGGTAAVETLARNAVVSSAAGGVLDFGFRIVAGQPIQQAVIGAAGTTAGSAAGIILGTAVGGPIGGFVGGSIGGFIGGRIADFIYAQSRPSAGNIFNSKEKLGILPFKGGQSPVQYSVTWDGKNNYTGQVFVDGYALGRQGELWGPIQGIVTKKIDTGHPDPLYKIRTDYYIRAKNASGATTDFLMGSGSGEPPHFVHYNLKPSRYDYQPDTGGDPLPLPIAKDTRTPDSINHPLNQSSAPPSAMPSAGSTPDTNNYIPGGTASRANGTPRGDSPDWVSHGAPKGSPHPVNMPAPLLSPLSEFANPEPTSKLNLIPSLLPIPKNTPSIIVNENGTVELIDYKPVATSDLQPISLDQSFPSTITLTSPASDPGKSTTTPFSVNGDFSAKPNEPLNQSPTSSLPTTTRGSFQPDATRAIPASTAPPVAGEPKPKESPELISKFDDIGLVLVGLTQVVQGLQNRVQTIENNTSPQAIQNAANAGTCEAFNPGGCNADIRNNAKNAADNSANSSNNMERVLNNTSNLADLTLLPIINNKLGPQVNGGLSGFLQRFARSTHLDKILNALTLLTVLHNAAMLSNNLAVTLGELTSQALSAIGIKDENDSSIDVNAILGKEIQEFFKSILGESVYNNLKLSFQKGSRIVQSARNLHYTVTSMFDSARSIAEWTAENTGRIGNALKRFRVVGSQAYNWMPERVNSQTAIQKKWDRMREGLDDLDDAAGSLSSVLGEVQNVQEEFKQLKEQKEEFKKSLESATPQDRPNNVPVKTAVDEAKGVSSTSVSISTVDREKSED